MNESLKTHSSPEMDTHTLEPLLSQFDSHAKDGILEIPESQGQCIVRKESPQHQAMMKAVRESRAFFVTEHTVGDEHFSQFVIEA